MITFTIYNHNKTIVGFESKGHAGYAESGHDIICAAVSILTQNTVDCIKSFTDDKYDFYQNDKDAHIRFILKNTDSPGDDAVLLLKSLKNGMMALVMGDGSEYIDLFFKEV